MPNKSKSKPKLKTYGCYGTTLKVRAASPKAAREKFTKYLVGQIKEVGGDWKGMIITQADIKAHTQAGKRFLQRRRK